MALTHDDLQAISGLIKSELKDFEGSMKNELKNTEASMKNEITDIKVEITGIKDNVASLNNEITDIKVEITGIKDNVASLNNEMNSIKLTLENETNRNIKIIAEGHLNLSRKLDDALKVTSEREMFLIRLNRLENEMRIIR